VGKGNTVEILVSVVAEAMKVEGLSVAIHIAGTHYSFSHTQAC